MAAQMADSADAAGFPGLLPAMALLRSAPLRELTEKVSSLYDRFDHAFSPLVDGALKRAFGVELTDTPATRGLPLVGSTSPLALTLAAYLVVVLSSAWRMRSQGQKLREKEKEPMALQAAVLVHNFFLWALSLYMCCAIVIEAVRNKYTLWGNGYNPSELRMAHLIYLFYVSKYFELIDTFLLRLAFLGSCSGVLLAYNTRQKLIMVAKRSVRQITVLHVYHHCSIAAIWWAIAHHAPGGDAYFSAALNSGVHVAMYGYYFLAAAVGKDEKLRNKYLFWGRYVTQLQMIQFALNMVQASWNLQKHTPYPRWLNQLLFYYMISLLALFADFYVRKYMFRRRRPSRAKKDA